MSASTRPMDSRRFLRWQGVVSAGWFPTVVILLFLISFALIVLYAFSMAGSHLRYLSVGLLTAVTALLTGGLAGLVVGIPRDVSSGALRATTSRARPPVPAGDGTSEKDAGAETGAGKDAAGADTAARKDADAGVPPEETSAGNSNVRSFETSTNLAEISDWLTKLLLGAGLVSLTRLGRPLGRLIDTVARGLGPHGGGTGAAVDTAAAILIGYAVLGFLAGYLATTFSYGKRLQAMFPQ